ncbi:MAG: glycogen synthase GlgA [Epsilonproteobacteria bacterium]|nr:glycogen synthase GlgA [Campylobacterota bacterium]
MTNRPLNILFTVSEAVPFAKTGGLADVAGALPKALAQKGHNVAVVMPRYYGIDKSALRHLPGPLRVGMGPLGQKEAAVYESRLPRSDVPVYFIDHEAYFGRDGLYTDEAGESYGDNGERFVFLSKAAFALCEQLDFSPHIIHAHDWHTAAQPLLRNTRYADIPRFKEAATVLTLHNLQHQGRFDKGLVAYMESGWEVFNPYVLEDHGAVNLLKGGIAAADAVTTVSRRYAAEIRTPAFGFGLEEHLQAHAHKLYGILNGVDYEEWSPATDSLIAANFDRDDMAGKALCKSDLQRRFGLPQKADVPVIGFVGRLAEQKGIGLIAAAVHGLLGLDAQFVMLGTGEKWAEAFFTDIAARHPDRFACHIGYSNELAHRIEAGSDLFLMPSLFEPCGLNQIYSLRYGTPPIVRAVGGLDDTVVNFNPQTGEGNGFKFYDATPEALYHTVQWAVETYKNAPDTFAALRDRGMRARFDWDRAATEYETVYYAAYFGRQAKRLQ